MWAKQKQQSGFTIVELLIVIVVIGILAAVTIVAYNGIKQRAENTKTVQATSQYLKVIHSYAVLKGNYPKVESAYSCLGPIGTTCAKLSGSSTTCTNSQADGVVNAQTSFDAYMKEIISGPLPQLSAQSMSCGGNTYGGGYYRPSTGTDAVIVIYLKGNPECPNIGGVQTTSKTQQEDMTRCVLTLPTIAG